MSANTSWLNTITLPEFSDIVKKQFSFTEVSIKPVAAQLYIPENLTGISESSRRYDELDIETFASIKREGEDAKKARAGVGYSKTMTAKRVAKEIDISWEMRRYGQEYKVKSKLTALNNFVPNRMELDLTHLLTFATSTSYTDADGDTVTTTTGDSCALAYATHTLAHSSTTYRNRVSGDPAFSQGSLELAEELFVSNVMNNFGDRVPDIQPNVIFSTDEPSLTNDIRQVLESTADVDAAHAGVLNVYNRKYRHVVLPYLATSATGARDATKKRWWGLVCTEGPNRWQAYHGVFETPNLKTPSESNNGENVHNDDWTYGCRGSYGQVTVGARGLVMSCPTS
jgi:hypothetical protein